MHPIDAISMLLREPKNVLSSSQSGTISVMSDIEAAFDIVVNYIRACLPGNALVTASSVQDDTYFISRDANEVELLLELSENCAFPACHHANGADEKFGLFRRKRCWARPPINLLDVLIGNDFNRIIYCYMVKGVVTQANYFYLSVRGLIIQQPCRACTATMSSISNSNRYCKPAHFRRRSNCDYT